MVADPEDPVKDPAPGIILFCEEMYPTIKSRYGDLPVITESSDRAGTIEITGKDSQNEAQGIGTERDQNVRKEGMGMTARFAEEARNR